MPFLTAFVTESNASYRRFKEANYYCLEANNILSNEIPFEKVPERSIEFFEDNFPVEFYNIYQEKVKKETLLNYNEAEFTGQYINRTSKTSVLKIEDNYFLVEENETTFRLLFSKEFNLEHLKAISNYILKTKNKKTMFFLTDKEKSTACETENFNVIKGFFTVKNVTGDQSDVEPIFKSLVINLADKM